MSDDFITKLLHSEVEKFQKANDAQENEPEGGSLEVPEKAESRDGESTQGTGSATAEGAMILEAFAEKMREAFSLLGNPEFVITLSRRAHHEGGMFWRMMLHYKKSSLRCDIKSKAFDGREAEIPAVQELFSHASDAILSVPQE